MVFLLVLPSGSGFIYSLSYLRHHRVCPSWDVPIEGTSETSMKRQTHFYGKIKIPSMLAVLALQFELFIDLRKSERPPTFLVFSHRMCLFGFSEEQ